MSILDRYAAAAQECRTIGQQVGVRNCDDDPDWKAAEWVADDLFEQARAAGHSVTEILAASKPGR